MARTRPIFELESFSATLSQTIFRARSLRAVRFELRSHVLKIAKLHAVQGGTFIDMPVSQLGTISVHVLPLWVYFSNPFLSVSLTNTPCQAEGIQFP